LLSAVTNTVFTKITCNREKNQNNL
jgi:hypothetical protein